MTGHVHEPRRSAAKAVAAAASLGALLGLAACSNTYGTGTSPGMQTIQDLTGIVSIAGKKQEPISYAPRPDLVVPPSTAVLPPPEVDDSTANANWPKDPDTAQAGIAGGAAGTGGTPNQYWVGGKAPDANLSIAAADSINSPTLTPDQLAAAKKAMAEARGNTVAFDANGNPVRKYLTDPPVDYRLPDPTQPIDPVTPVKKKKKFLWWTIDD